ncbi:BnaCnng40310D [Brassica napus]|uniref:BnaCnng40310D protein n=1 Tax=Brassica napus TaxID=3708 RepID=A0A078JCM6_BRANA|nr:BnaCnng40310D [Brassica napus]
MSTFSSIPPFHTSKLFSHKEDEQKNLSDDEMRNAFAGPLNIPERSIQSS